MELPVEGRITQYFDTPVDYIAGRSRHEALDIVTDGSQPIKILGDCEVVVTIDKYGYNPNKGYGNELVVEYTGGLFRDRFCHLAEGSIVALGTTLLKGATGAWTGQTGYRVPITTFHTHMERLKLINGQWVRVDPLTNPLTEDDMTEAEKKVLALVPEQEKALSAIFLRLDAIEEGLRKRSSKNRVRKIEHKIKKLKK